MKRFISKLKAVNTRDKNFPDGKVERRRQHLEESVARYLALLDTADRSPLRGSRAGRPPREMSHSAVLKRLGRAEFTVHSFRSGFRPLSAGIRLQASE